MEIYQKIRTGIISALAWSVIVIMAALTLMVIWQVLSRYLVTPSILSYVDALPYTEPLSRCLNAMATLGKSSEELATALMIWAGLFGATVGFEYRSHLGVDVLVYIADAPSKKIMEFVTWCLVLAFAVIVLIVGGTEVLHEAFVRHNMLKTLPSICRGYVYIPIPLCGLIISWLCVEQLVSLVTGIRFRKDPVVNAELDKAEGAC